MGEKKTERTIRICSLCLSSVASGAGDDVPFTLQDPEAVIVWEYACDECREDLQRMPPNLARFSARLWNSLRTRVIDLFDEGAEIGTIWHGLLEAAIKVWQQNHQMAIQQAIAMTDRIALGKKH